MKTLVNKNIIVVFCLVILGCVGFLIVGNFKKKSDAQSTRIAVFQSATHPALDEIAQGFIDTMQAEAHLHYRFDRYNGNGNKILMQAQAQEILQRNYDLIFTIGVGCSLSIKDLCQKKQDRTPIVFTAVDNPIKLDLQGSTITGVIDATNYPEQLALFLAIKPSIQKLLLVYDQSQASGLERDAHEIKSILHTKGIICTSIEIEHIGELAQKVTGAIASADAVMILKDSTVVSGIDSLIKLCECYQVPLLATDLNSGIKGAALAYGIYEAESGIQAAYQAKLILEDGKLPSQVPVVAIKNMVMKINGKHARLQGLSIDPHDFAMAGIEFIEQKESHV